MRFVACLLLSVLFISSASAGPWEEFCEWRRRVGLPQVRYDPQMAAFAQSKANYRAMRGLHDSHAGPRCPANWREGCGEATPGFGWLTCCQEEDAAYGGAGMAVGADGDRYMVLVLRGGSGRALISRHNIPVFDTSHLSPEWTSASLRLTGGQRVRAGYFGRRSAKSTVGVCPKCGKIH